MHPSPRASAQSASSCDPVLRTGVYVGALLSALAFIWLLVANRMPSVEGFALERNLAAASVMGLFLLVPVCRFLKFPAKLFFFGVIAWTMLTLSYGAMSNQFPALADRPGAFHLFVLGAAGYGLASVLAWVAIDGGNCVYTPASCATAACAPYRQSS